jgi:hypothetical protein
MLNSGAKRLIHNRHKQFTAIVTVAADEKEHPDIKSLALYNYLLTNYIK